jgi:hypothetical protein
VVASLALLAGCTPGPNLETLVDELRIVAIEAEPPVAVPGDMVTLTVHVADPEDVSPDVGLWTCTGFGGICLEESAERMVRPEGDAPLFSAQVRVPLESMAVVQEVGEIGLWGLACPADTCPEYFPEGTDSVDPELLADPFTALEELPLEGISLVRKSIALVETSGETLTNPTLTPDFEIPTTIGQAEELTLQFTVEGEASEAYGYSTAGGFTMPEEPVVDGVLTLDWFAPETSGQVTLWVIAQGNDFGGNGVWTGSLLVE